MSQQFYRRHAEEFFKATVGVDMKPIHQRFLAGLQPQANILDAGCGSGRDAKAFADAGFEVSAFDASEELAALATAHCGFEVAVRRFDDVTEEARYDGIWCCASLLHVPANHLPETLGKLWRALRPGGRLYVSFKHGTGERIRGERLFTDADEATVRQWFSNLVEMQDLSVWLTTDQRPDRAEQWTNALAFRADKSPRRLVTGGEDHFLPHLSEAFSRATQADLAVAFITQTGLRLLLPDLQSMVDSGPPLPRPFADQRLSWCHRPCGITVVTPATAARRRGAGLHNTRVTAFTSRRTSLRAWKAVAWFPGRPSSAPAISASRHC
jgi:SAM-dependent methyltransferase